MLACIRQEQKKKTRREGLRKVRQEWELYRQGEAAMGEVIRVQFQDNQVAEMEKAAAKLDQGIAEAIDRAKEENLPAGLVVALLQGHLFIQTQEMIDDGREG